jgi:phosphoribosylglycinamide formyltransferase 1
MHSLVVLISGRGSNLKAIAQACKTGVLSGQAPHPIESAARIVGVIADRPDCQGSQLAEQLGISNQVVCFKDFDQRVLFERQLQQTVDKLNPNLVVLAGFMRILGEQFVQHYAGRMINIHPSLLPAFPGLKTHEQALAAGVKEHGATVHWVTPQLDHGPSIMQAVVPVLIDDTPEQLAQRVLQVEHDLYPQAIATVLAQNNDWFRTI